MIMRKEIDFNEPLTEEQKEMLAKMQSREAVPDEDSPELTQEQLNKLVAISKKRREERKKLTVTIRLSPQALKTAKSLGKGYTSVLSRILESTLSDADLIKNYL